MTKALNATPQTISDITQGLEGVREGVLENHAAKDYLHLRHTHGYEGCCC